MIKKIETANQTQFALMQGWSKSYVTELKKSDRLVFTADGLVDVEASLLKIKETQDPNRVDVKERHATKRRKSPALTIDQICQHILTVRIPDQDVRTDAVGLIRKAETIQLSKSRADKEHWLGLQAKLDYETSLGLMVNKKDMIDFVADLVTTFRQELENLPHLVASDLFGKDVDLIRATLKQSVRNTLANLERGCADKILKAKSQ